MESFQFKNHPTVCKLLLASTCLAVILAWFRVESSTVHAFDTGIYMQILTSFLNFGDLQSSITTEHNFFAHHFQPAILILAPFFYVWPSAYVLFGASLFSTLIATWIFARLFYPCFKGNHVVFGAFVMMIFWNPAILFRSIYSFVPEIFALPCFVYHGYLLGKADVDWSKHFKWLLFTLIFSGLCKENIWLIHSFTCLLLAVKYPKFKLRFGLVSFFSISFFLFLFTYWMPANTVMESYYGARFFMNPEVMGKGYGALLKSMVYNIFSLRSLETLFMIVLTTAGFAFFRLNYALLGAIPGLLFVLAAYHFQVHHLGNHYPVMFLGFLYASAAFNLKVLMGGKYDFLARYCSLGAVVMVVFMSFLSAGGIVESTIITMANPQAWKTHGVLGEISSKIKPEAILLADGNYVPQLSLRHRNVKMFLGFGGNPTTLTDDDLKKTTDVLTTFDLRKREGGCEGIEEPATPNSGVRYNYKSFYHFCKWILSNKMVVDEYPEAKLVHYHY